MENNYNNCRWCKWFVKGNCTNAAFGKSDIEIYKFSEEGVLSEAIQESFGNIKFNYFEQALFESSVSKKKSK